MTIINNGARRRLIIGEVFEGVCGESRGILAFIPNRSGKRPEDARGALLDGEPVALLDVAKADGSPSYTARYRVL